MTYWNSKGTHQELYEKLHKLIPISGAVPRSRSDNKALDRLRRAANYYYDLYNNGLCNHRQAFCRMFGWKSWDVPQYRDKLEFWPKFVQDLEDKMDAMIIAAAIEQGMKAEAVGSELAA